MDMTKPVIFTDLDGTLLDPADYSFSEAAPALERIKKGRIPLVCVSSKTRAEIEYIRMKLSNTDPFITENGGGILIPSGYFPFATAGENVNGYRFITLGRPYREVRDALVKARAGIDAKVKGFGDMTKEEISRLTGLSLHEAELSKKRDFDEPFIFEGGKTAEERLAKAIEGLGFSCKRERLLHITGPHDKGKAVRILKDYFTELYGNITTIALGDGLNDVPLLKEADYPVLVKKEDGSYVETGVPGVVRADGIGPTGWNKAIMGILDSIEAFQTGYRC